MGAGVRTLAAAAASVLAGMLAAGAGCATDPTVRVFSNRPIAWHEHDAENVPRAPKPTDIDRLDSALMVRDDMIGVVDRALALEGARPARDVNAAD
jgi:hypothetical protein